MQRKCNFLNKKGYYFKVVSMRHYNYIWTGRLLSLMLALIATAAEAQISFTDVSTASGVARTGESYGASWGDLNGDGYPDIFASNHRQQPSLFLNRGNGTFFETGNQVFPWVNRSARGYAWRVLGGFR